LIVAKLEVKVKLLTYVYDYELLYMHVIARLSILLDKLMGVYNS